MKNANKTQPATWKVGTSWSPDSSVSLHEVKAAGLNCIELVISRDQPDLSIRGITNKFDPYILKAKNMGLEIWSIHFPFGEVWDISTIDVFKRNEIIRSHEEWLQWVSDWGIKNVIIHPSYEPISGNDRKSRIEASKDSLYQLAEKARQININICVEDLP
ncbi:sugar phosphate isomerase/epimerase, partial [Bacillus sp. IITD106]|nr:sugar phosphate isomerase/epimerase [Bacillus sp. IITD106]